MAEKENVELVQQTYAAFGRGDFETVFNNFAPDIVWQSRYTNGVPLDGTYQGKEEVMKFFQTLGETLEVHEYVPQKFLSQDDTVVVLGYEKVTAKPTGKTYTNEWVQVWTIQNDKLAKLQSSNDVAVTAAAFATT